MFPKERDFVFLHALDGAQKVECAFLTKKKKTFLAGLLFTSLYYSGSQPGCRGTLECRKIVSGVPPVITFIDLWTCF